MEVTITEFSSFKIGELSEGCKHCVLGKKLVLFITGACPRKCWYCPVADEKFQNDVIYANEEKIISVSDAINEAILCNASGAGITGGDPLTRLNRCLEYIKSLKIKFGKEFHIHLYTSFDLVNENNLKELFDAGLDEIRFHADFYNKNKWNNIYIAKKFNWKIGIEIPCIPDLKKETYEIIEFFKDKVDFFNLNELEAADSKRNLVFDKGYKSKNELSYGIKGSEELALEILNHYKDKNINIHFCTSRLKNNQQLGNRIKLRAENIKKNYDIVTKNGSLIRGAIYIDKPSFNYLEHVKQIEETKIVNDLENLKNKLTEKFGIIDIGIDKKKFRLFASKKFVEKNKKYLKSINLYPAVVEELATCDLFEIEIDFL
ncbi:radical SAM protein [Candidatus Woesearchaeota archaeon]|nr:radical SAM protein [Candidatus Woesearchaeota archaeon]HLD10724.1 radical SAM protein [Candidatus Nanoarchaeia archaeon]